MTATKASESSSCGKCLPVVILTVLLQAVFSALTYVYLTSEMKQMQDKYSKSGIACFFKEDDGSWDPHDEDSMNGPCWQVRWELRQFVRKISLRTYEEIISTGPEKQVGPLLVKGPQKAAAHITGNKRRAPSFPIPKF